MSRIAAIAVLFIVIDASSQPFHMAGRVVDSISSMPIVNAKIHLIGSPAISAVSNDSGRFVLDWDVTAVNRAKSTPVQFEFAVNGSDLILSGLPNHGSISVSVFNSVGSQLLRSERQMSSGIMLKFTDLWASSGIYFVKINTDQVGVCLRVCSITGSHKITNQIDMPTARQLGKALSTHIIEINGKG